MCVVGSLINFSTLTRDMPSAPYRFSQSCALVSEGGVIGEGQKESIAQAIRDGTLDAQSMHCTLLMEIRREVQRKVVDMKYVNACEKLLELLNRDRASTVANHYEENLAVIKRKLHHTPHR